MRALTAVLKISGYRFHSSVDNMPSAGLSPDILLTFCLEFPRHDLLILIRFASSGTVCTIVSNFVTEWRLLISHI